MDLLALRQDGRLVVIELKVSEDREHVLQGADYWRRVELQHSPRALSIPEPEHPRYKKVHGDQALVARRAIEALTASIVPDSEPAPEPALRS